MNGYIKVPVEVVLSFVARRKLADQSWIDRLFWCRWNVANRFRQLQGKTPSDYLPNSWVWLPDYYFLDTPHPAEVSS